MKSFLTLLLLLSTLVTHRIMASDNNKPTTMEQDSDSDDDNTPIVHPNTDHQGNERPKSAVGRRISQPQLDLLRRIQEQQQEKANNSRNT